MNFSKDEFLKKSLAEKIYLIAFVVAIVSLFLPWVNIGIMSVNGFQQSGYLIMIPLLYCLITTLMNKERNKIIGLVLSVISAVIMFFFIRSKSTSFLGSTINVASTGMYVMLIATIAFVVAGIIELKNK